MGNMSTKPNNFVTQISHEAAEKLKEALPSLGFELSKPAYTLFQGTKKGISVTCYTSLKLVVQGKDFEEFIEFYLEPEILKSFDFRYKEEKEEEPDLTPRIGVDEAGKGDFFGPLCAAALYADGPKILELKKMGVKDSKELSDQTVINLAKKIRASCIHSIIKINPLRYNDLYSNFGNLNTLLAWAHATAIESLSKISGCTCVIVDQFAHESVILKALQKKKICLDVTQRHKAENDLVVAGASILARAAFLEGLKQLSDKAGVHLPKGASKQCIEAGKNLVRKYGKDALKEVAKLHFRTTGQVLEEEHAS
jgi:ribonuclease HIII